MAYNLGRRRGQTIVFLVNGERITVRIGKITTNRVRMEIDADKELVKIVHGEKMLPIDPVVVTEIPLPTPADTG